MKLVPENKADAIRDYRPTMPLSPIKRTYNPTIQPQLSQDNRSGWQRKQDSQKADKAYNQYIEDKKTEKGLRDLNGFLTFTDYATMGFGAGSLLFKGMKYAGRKAISQVSKNIANSRNMGIVAKPFQRGGFQSELDWSPKSWFEDAGKWKGYNQSDIDALASHVPEYHGIEKATKANGTWLKLPNGKTWEGDARSWVQLQSKEGQKMAMPSKVWKNGVSGDNVSSYPAYQGDTWMSDHPDVYNNFAYNKKGFYRERPEGNTYSLTIPKETKIAQKDAMGKDFGGVEHKGKTLATDEIVKEAKNYGYGATRISNVVEGPHYLKNLNVPTNDFVIHEGTPRKSILGNNGNFDLNNKNIYRGFIPLGLIGGVGYGNK